MDNVAGSRRHVVQLEWTHPCKAVVRACLVAEFCPTICDVCLQCRRPGFNPWIGTIPWRRQWHPTPVLLPRKSHGLRSLAGYSPWVTKSRTRLSDCTSISFVTHGLQPARFLCPWDFPGKNTSKMPFPAPGGQPRPPCLLHWQADSLPLSHLGS